MANDQFSMALQKSAFLPTTPVMSELRPIGGSNFGMAS